MTVLARASAGVTGRGGKDLVGGAGRVGLLGAVRGSVIAITLREVVIHGRKQQLLLVFRLLIRLLGPGYCVPNNGLAGQVPRGVG